MTGYKYLKIVLFTGYKCNNKCLFCIDADKRNIQQKSTSELLKNIYEAKNLGVDILEIIGGESTIRKDFFQLIKFAKQLGIKEVVCVTNGRVFFEEDNVKKIIDSGIDSVILSIHGSNPKIHDSLTQSAGSFNQAIIGIENFLKNNFTRLNGNTTVVKQNFKDVPDIAKIYAKYKFWNVEYIFVDPTYGGAYNNFDLLVPRISDAAPYMQKAIDIGLKNNLSQWKARYVPLCLFKNYLEHISEINERELYLSQHWAPDFINRDSINSRAEISRIKTDKCFDCGKNNICEGIWRKYIEEYGDSELEPFK